MRTALTIAGSDSSGGAGIQADLEDVRARTASSALSAITAVTAQNTLGVTRRRGAAPGLRRRPDRCGRRRTFLRTRLKIGMLANAGIIEAVAAAIARHRLPNVVLDTVMVAKSRARLLDADAVAALRTRLLPLAAVITPNVPEAEALTGLTHRHRGRSAPRRDSSRGDGRARGVGQGRPSRRAGHRRAVGTARHGHRASRPNGSRHRTRTGPAARCRPPSPRGSRWATTSRRRRRAAKAYVTRAIAQAPGLGHGHGPLGPAIPSESLRRSQVR